MRREPGRQLPFSRCLLFQRGSLCSAGTWVALPSTSGSSAHSFFCIKDPPTLSITSSPIPLLLLIQYELMLARKRMNPNPVAAASNPESVCNKNTNVGVNFAKDTCLYCCSVQDQSWPSPLCSAELQGPWTPCDAQMTAFFKSLFLHFKRNFKEPKILAISGKVHWAT